MSETNCTSKGGLLVYFRIKVSMYLASSETFLHINSFLSFHSDHIDYLVNRTGADHVGLGADYDGVTQYWSIV